MTKSDYAKQAYGRKGYKRYKKIDKIKKMVTGEGPTLLEKIAAGVGGVASVAKAVLPAIAAINTEVKYSDKTAAVNAYVPGTNDVIVALTDQIAQGTSDITRVGNSIKAQDLQLRLAMNFASSATVLGLHCRMMLIVWKENAQQNPITAAKLFESPTNLYSAMNKDYTDQFVVLKDKFFALNNPSGAAQTVAFQHMKLFKKTDFHIRFDGSTGANATQNHIYLILRSSSTGLATSLSTTYYSRLNYTDN